MESTFPSTTVPYEYIHDPEKEVSIWSIVVPVVVFIVIVPVGWITLHKGSYLYKKYCNGSTTDESVAIESVAIEVIQVRRVERERIQNLRRDNENPQHNGGVSRMLPMNPISTIYRPGTILPRNDEPPPYDVVQMDLPSYEEISVNENNHRSKTLT